jgi:hypothetical protein
MRPADRWLCTGLIAGLLLVVLGVQRLQHPRLSSAVRAKLESELGLARHQGHPVELLVADADDAALASRARAVAASSRTTVLALSTQSAAIAPDSFDTTLANDAEWTRIARQGVGLFLDRDDLPGAAAMLVRIYTAALVQHGILPALPPMPPLLYPDVERRPSSSSDAALAGLGLALLVVVAGCWLELAVSPAPHDAASTDLAAGSDRGSGWARRDGSMPLPPDQATVP